MTDFGTSGVPEETPSDERGLLTSGESHERVDPHLGNAHRRLPRDSVPFGERVRRNPSGGVELAGSKQGRTCAVIEDRERVDRAGNACT
jgi:hypothetical protein